MTYGPLHHLATYDLTVVGVHPINKRAGHYVVSMKDSAARVYLDVHTRLRKAVRVQRFDHTGELIGGDHFDETALKVLTRVFTDYETTRSNAYGRARIEEHPPLPPLKSAVTPPTPFFEN